MNSGVWGGEGRMTAVTSCRTCGAEPLENARFCHGCGSPVAESDTHAEYKQVTVLFADVVHSMDIATAHPSPGVSGRETRVADAQTVVLAPLSVSVGFLGRLRLGDRPLPTPV